jgi:ferrochelatase
MEHTNQIGILLVNTGTPESPTPEATKRYLAEFLMDPCIRPLHPLPWWCILHGAILPKRSVASAKKYEHIWTPFGSPLEIEMTKLAQGLQAFYTERELAYTVLHAQSYSNPRIASALATFKERGISHVIVLPLYPQSAYSTTGSVRGILKKAQASAGFTGTLEVIDNYHNDAAYIQALAESIRAAGFNPASNDLLLFSYHSIPLVDIEEGDTYPIQTETTAQLVARELGITPERWALGYQCRFDKSRTWLSPYSKDLLDEWAQTAGKNARVFMVCPNFSIDCLETLYDISLAIEPEYRKRLEQACESTPAEDAFTYIPCLNSSKAHVEVLNHVISPYTALKHL